MTVNQERTFIMVKPDGVQRGLVGKLAGGCEVHMGIKRSFGEVLC